MEFNIRPGLSMEKSERVTDDNTANKYASGGVEVYATPAMIGLMENAAYSCVQNGLPEGWSTVGTALDVKHLAATPVGLTVTARAEVVVAEGRRLLFKVEAFDNREKIGEGTHERFIINLDKFLNRVKNKQV